MSGGRRVAQVLERQGVRHLFTLCGGHISPILVECKRIGIRVVDVRHEATAVFAADAVARLTGVPGVAAVTAGPGVTNTITAVKNAQLAQSPVVLLGGATATLLRGRGSLQDIDQLALIRPHVKSARRVTRVSDLVPALDDAFVAARSGVPGPVFVECPVDLLYPPEVVRRWYEDATGIGRPPRNLRDRALRYYVRRHLARLTWGVDAPLPPPPDTPPPPPPGRAQVERARSLVRASRRPVLVLGSQAMLQPDRAAVLAGAVASLGMPTYLTGMARGLLGPSHPLQRRHARRQSLKEADLAILAGAPCDFRLDYGRQLSAAATLISANRDRADLRRNRRPTLAVHAAPELFLTALADAIGAPSDWSAWREATLARDEARDAEIATRAEAPTDHVNPLRLCREVEARLGDRTTLVADGGDFVSTASYILRPRAPLSWLDPGVFGTLGVGAGFALGASLCRPEDDVWILYGDGSVGYTLSELDTFVRHRLPVIALVGNDAGWTQIAREQVEVLGDDVGTSLADTAYDAVARGFGACGIRVDDPGQVGPALDLALEAARNGQPALVNARIGRTDFRKGSISI